MAAVFESLMTSKKGWRDGRSDLSKHDGVYISAPNGLQFKNAAIRINEVDSVSDYESRGRFMSNVIVGKASSNFEISEKASRSILTKDSRQRSRSQSGASDKRQERTDNRIRSSSTNRTGTSRDVVHHQSSRERESIDFFDRNALSGMNRSGQNASNTSNSFRAQKEVLPASRSHATIQLNSPESTRQRSHSLGNHHKTPSYLPEDTDTILSRSQSPAVTILSPVSETFDNGHVSSDTQLMTGATKLSFSRNNNTKSVRGPASATSSRIERAKSPLEASLASANDAAFINPLAAHITVSSMSHRRYHSLQSDTSDTVQKSTIQQRLSDKPLPACPIGSSRSPPLQCTAFMRASSRTGPGLASTSIMRPASRNDHIQSRQKHDQPPFKPRQRSSSLGPVAHAVPFITPVISTKHAQEEAAISVGEEIYLDHSQPSSASSDSDVSLTSRSTQSSTSVPTPTGSPDLQRQRRVIGSPVYQLDSLRKQSDPSSIAETGHFAWQPPKSTASPAPSMANTITNNGSIYDELRDDLRFVARDMSAMTLAAQQERERKMSKLRVRARARSASRQGRQSDRSGNGGRDFDNHHNYTYHQQNEKSDLNGSWGNTAYTPAYGVANTLESDRNYTDHLRGEAEIIVLDDTKQNIAIVPDYEDLWG